MTPQTLLDDYNYFTAELSKQVRNLSLAGIAVIWALRPSNSLLPENAVLRWAEFAFVLTLVLDMVFLIYSTIVSNRYYHCLEKQGKKLNEECDGWSIWFVIPKRVLRWAKVITCCIGYLLILLYVVTAK